MPYVCVCVCVRVRGCVRDAKHHTPYLQGKSGGGIWAQLVSNGGQQSLWYDQLQEQCNIWTNVQLSD